MRGVDAIDIERRIGLSEPLGLRVGEDGGERQVLGLHPRQDVIAGSIEDAVDAQDAVRRRAVTQRLDDRDAASDRRLILERNPLRLRQRGEVEAVVGKHRFVRGNERLAAFERRPRQYERRAVAAADHLDDDIDIVARAQLSRVVDPRRTAEIDPPVAPAVARRHGGDDNRAVGAPLDEAGVRLEESNDPGADRPEARQADAQGGGHRRCPAA